MSKNIFSNKGNILIVLLGMLVLPEIVLGQSLEEGFKNPPMSARPKGYWCWVNGNFNLSQIPVDLKEFKDKGMGGVDIWDVAGWVDPNRVIPSGPSFMGQESVDAIAHSVRVGTELGLEMGLTISSSWNAGGDWVKPEDGVMGLFQSSVCVSGPGEFDNYIGFPTLPEEYDSYPRLYEKDASGLPTFYKDVALLAIKSNKDTASEQGAIVINLTTQFRDGHLRWVVPEGDWLLVRYVCTGTGQPLLRPSPNSNGLMIDHFSANALKKHLDFFFEKLEDELGDLSKTALKYFYTDSYEANSAAWTPNMTEEFEKRNGYDLIPFIPALSGFIIQDKETTDRFLFDFKKTLSDLIIENHYALATELCKKEGIGFIAEAGGPGPPIHNCPFESLSSLGKCSVPRGEFWFSPNMDQKHIDELQIVKGPASAAHLYNQPRVEAEAFTGTELWQFGPGDLKQAADRAMCEGLTSFIYHTSPHILPEAGSPGWVYNFGTIINSERVWWPKSAAFHHYIGRSCFLLQQGNFVGDVLFYYGDRAPNFATRKQFIPSLGFGYDYDYTNSDIILNRLDVKNGRFILPHGQSYKILVLPDEIEIDPQVMMKLEEFILKGGVLVGNKPTRSCGLANYEENDKKVRKIADNMWIPHQKKMKYGLGWIYTKEVPLSEVLSDQSVFPDVKAMINKPENVLDYIHRETDSADIYFFRNRTNALQSFCLDLRSVKGMPEFWDPDNSSITPDSVFVQGNNRTVLPVKLDAYGSVFVVFRGNTAEKHIVKVIRDGELLFPGTFNGVSINNQGRIVANEQGSYELVYSDGNKENNTVGNKPTSQSIVGQWEVRFPFGWDAPQSVVFDSLISWTDSYNEGIKYFSGIASYHKSFEINGEQLSDSLQIILDLGKVSKVAEVYLNGHQVKTCWHAPYRSDITEYVKEGTNYLVVEVANVLSNRLSGDDFRKWEDKRTHTNITKGPTAWKDPWKEVPLVESGLMGPVKIEFGKKVN